MWSWEKKDKIETSELYARLADMERANAALQGKLDSTQRELDKFKSEFAKATPCIDFDIMRVFSIERNPGNGLACTMIGYYMNEPVISSDGEMIVNRDVVKEWTLYCNTERHEELIKQFIEWKAKNGS
jgi:hypothetical protein